MTMEELTEREDFEIVPINPLRKLEKRMDMLEENTVTHRELKEMFNVARLNQQSIDDIVKLNKNMIENVSDLTNSVSNIANKMSDFLSRIEVEELPPGKEIRGITDFSDRLVKLENRLNALIIALSPKIKKPVQRPGYRPAIRPQI